VTGKPTLYVILGSHACRTGMLLLDHKGIDYRPVNLPSGFHPLFVRLRGFPGNPGPVRELTGAKSRALALGDRLGTVPALAFGADRVQGNLEIARFLDRVQPDPPLYPADLDRRQEVEEEERWGNEVFQMVARRLALAAVLHGPDAIHDRGNSGRLGPMLWHHDAARFLGVHLVGRFAFGATRKTEPEMLAALPAMLDRIDARVGAGVLNGEQLNAADLMIAPSLALLAYRRDLRPEIKSRPALALIDRLLPEN
jgi:glutathione S-transferase